MQQHHQYVFITDRSFLRPTLISLWSLLRHTSSSPVIHFWGDQLTDDDWEAVDRIIEIRSDARLCRLDLSTAEMQNAIGPSASKHVTAATMARLFIPSKLTGRVLYVDGDTIITDDTSEIFYTDMRGNPIGAVRDIVMTKRHIRGDRSNASTRAKMKACSALIGKSAIGDYVNAGVLLIDTEAIRAQPDIHAAMKDISRASAWPYGDQDHINHVFSNRIHYLNPAWNASWGRVRRQQHFIALNNGYKSELERKRPAIIHFHGPDKPWKTPRYDFWSAKGRAVMEYRKDMSRYLQTFPNLAP